MGIINKLTQLTINKHIFLIMYNIIVMTLEIDKKKIKIFNNFEYPFDNLHTQSILACISAKSMQGKSFVMLEIIKKIKNTKNMGCIVMGGSTKRSPCYEVLAEYFKDRIEFLEEYTDDIFDKFEELIETKPYSKFDNNILIIDDILGCTNKTLIKRLEKAITQYRHFGIHLITMIQQIKSVSIPKVFRTNVNCLFVSSKSANDLIELNAISQISENKLNMAIEEANKHEYSFICYLLPNDYYMVYSTVDGWI